ncbi:GumC family protein [Vibrio lentus]|uniref:non-specific protein-tyrosine kinase n=1 Tax=Vibrio lentus TaxID=136468 RepID=A0AA44VRR3_9VIBR|nr:polysaccharide biosynthesis tyrosine autokinase [Vibrio lentus]MCB5358419.1 polysaccharide biosynthesis tyrosine autokinase [Vibrio lentus]MCB5448887.1 polysaccharide biosynthesis tyrosine autokinase [Vibrio lentus]MCB5460774.1 polysaccharide biosynthesis tyrosine autokinase [Vibrio lentus]MCC4796032.1 polysaccharide biosynthesis tyrosine autokinase [Vibrio lentus]MCC4853402.1 polysaccharide biosynthesis tyrosine autokinase [Vibrio lentus]
MQLLSKENKLNNEEIIDLGKYIILLKQNWLKITMFSLVVTILTTLVVFSLTPKYVATATLLIESEQKKAVSIEEVVGIDSSQKEYYLTQFEILKSNQIAERVIDKLGLTNKLEFNASLSTEPSLKEQLVDTIKSLPVFDAYRDTAAISEEDAQEAIRQEVLDAFKERLTISPIRKTQLVKISFESEDPKVAARIANAVGEAYINQNLEASLGATQQASHWITSRLAELKEQLKDSETALTDFLAKEKLVDDSGVEGGIDAQARATISNLTQRLTEITDRRIEIESSYSTLKAAQGKTNASFISIPLVSKHPQVLALKEEKIVAEKELSELAKRYGPAHEDMKAATAKVRSLDKQLNSVVRELVNGIDQERKSVSEQARLLTAELKAKKDAYQNISVKKRQFEALKREVKTNRDVFNLFLSRQKETSATSDFAAESARFTDYAMIPQQAAAPKKKMIIALSLVASISFAVVMVFLLDALRNTVESVKNFEDRFGLIPLGGIPKIALKQYKNKALDKALYFEKDANSFSESVRSIRTALTLSKMHNPNKRVAITSSLPGEGKTTTAINLAMAYAQVERTLLIDGDLRKPAVAERFGLKKFQQGITNHLLMGDAIESCLHKDEQSGLTILPAGMLTPNPQELITSEGFAKVLEQLDDQFDRIIIDTPPTLPVADSMVISRLVGSITVVVKANSTRIASVRNTLARFMTHNIKIDGIVINQVTEKALKNEYGYGGYYGSYGDNHLAKEA